MNDGVIFQQAIAYSLAANEVTSSNNDKEAEKQTKTGRSQPNPLCPDYNCIRTLSPVY